MAQDAQAGGVTAGEERTFTIWTKFEAGADSTFQLNLLSEIGTEGLEIQDQNLIISYKIYPAGY